MSAFLRSLGLIVAVGFVALLPIGNLQAQITIRHVIGNADPAATASRYPEVQEAIACYSRNEIPVARAYLKAAGKKHGNLPPADLMLANLLIAGNGSVASAKAELEECIKSNPDDPEAYLVLADTAFGEGKTDDAERQFSKAEQLAPKLKTNELRRKDCRIRAAAGLAAVAERQTHWDEAKGYLEKWLALQPHSAAAHYRLGRVLFDLDASPKKEDGAAKARKQFAAAVADDETSIGPDIALAMLYQEANLHDKAGECMARAVQKLPPDKAGKLAVLLAASRWGLMSDEPKEAQRYAELALSADPKSIEAKYCKGVAARLLRDIKTAEKCFEEVHFDSPANFAASNLLVQILVEQDDKEKKRRGMELAEVNYRAYARENGSFAYEAAGTYAWTLYQMDRKAEAAQILRIVAKTGYVNPDCAYFLARVLIDQGESEKALPVLEAALKGDYLFAYRQDAKDLLAKIKKRPADKTGEPKTKEPPAHSK